MLVDRVFGVAVALFKAVLNEVTFVVIRKLVYGDNSAVLVIFNRFYKDSVTIVGSFGRKIISSVGKT